MTGLLHSWRAAIRIARRDAWRSKGRSLLVLLMIALPIVGVSAADITIRSGQISEAQKLERRLGAADARYESADTGGAPIMQEPKGDYGFSVAERYEEDPRVLSGKHSNVIKALPKGAKWITEGSGRALARTRHGLLDISVRELDAGHPLAAGIFTLLRGDLPARPNEVAATEAFLKSSGLHVGSHTTLRGMGGALLTIVGAVEAPDELEREELLARPGAVLPVLDRAAAKHGESTATTNYLVSVGGRVTWDMAKEANAKGVMVMSKDVVLNPPADQDVPLYTQGDYQRSGDLGTDQTMVVMAATVVGMAMLEICLLAGPAFAVGARRSRRQLGLVGANGGDRRHIRAIVLSGGLVIGTAAAVIGVALGFGLTLALRPILEDYVGARFGAIQLRPLELTGIAAVGLVTGVLAAIVPAFVASRQSVLESLTGRRGVRHSSRVLPLVGLGAVLLGVGIALVGSLSYDNVLGVAAGSGIAELGIVALTPALVGLFGRLGRWMPLSPRLALRDAVRNRGRTAPAVAAVLAAVAGTVGVATYAASADQQHRQEYRRSLPEHRAALSVDADEKGQLGQIRATVAKTLPVAERADVDRIWVGGKDCGPYSGSNGCGSIELVVPERNTCPLEKEDTGAHFTAAQRRGLRKDWRCEQHYENGWGAYMMRSGSDTLVGGPQVLAALGIHDPSAERALRRGETVVFDRKYVKDGRITLKVIDRVVESDQEQKGRPVPVKAHLAQHNAYGLVALMPRTAAAEADFKTAPFGSYYTLSHGVSTEQRQELKGALAKLNVRADPYIERGYQADSSLVLMALSVFAGLVTIGAAGIATGLSQADAEADLNTLAAIGAAPRVRRTLSGFQCGVVAAMGVALGAAAGVVPAIGLRKAQERQAVAQYEEAVRLGRSIGTTSVHMPIVVPWTTLLELLVAVPLGAALLAALFTRSRTAPARRAAQ
ncbi:FtsX-like permease family protein [Wenjunlia tyrosinilytica]|uniref:ABC3 transporter permease C-terminal domain-containing protein n=1 Tax=Wenjunlia tyrosinilytica TaxID=1544741 RepID=A0A918DVX3_9ACTN|nr:ABC transporter permease [Wenjunlia tyrosinilytica]GGO84580.1 hypothetical protein GCM10012280_16370 [Wenjunlia tyrosinilytica]